MHVREAKDFLVQQTSEQATLEGVPLSDLEKRMMYFTEGKGALEDPAALNDEFEAQYDTATYEKKMSGLMRNAYRRLKKDNPEGVGQWNNAVRALGRGDHYILVLCSSFSASGARGSWRIYLVTLLPLVVLLAIALLFGHGRNSDTGLLSAHLPPLNPWVTRVVQALFLVLLVLTVFFPRVLIRVASKCFDPILDWVLRPLEKEEPDE